MSFGIKILVKNLDRLDKKVKAIAKAKTKAQRRALTEAAYLVAGEAKRLVQQGPKTGEVYGKHRASSPGEAPATDTGNLVRSITVDPLKGDEVITITTRSPYSAALEFGKDDGTLLPRPFMAPAMKNNEKEIKALITEAYRGD